MSLPQNIDLGEIKLKLYERLKLSGWGDKLKMFILSDAFDTILAQLLKEARAGERFTPPLKKVFRAFEECPYNNLKIVMIGQDPYPYPDIADGIAFSVSNDAKFNPPSLKFMFKEIERTVYPLDGYTWDTDLARWSNQGVLMINTAFTTTIGKVGKHYDLWHGFIAFLLDTLASYNPGLIYVFMGKVAKEWSDLVPDTNHKLFTTHPASAAHTLKETWDSQDVFNKINNLSFKHYGQLIKW